MHTTPIESWRPKGITELEPNAWKALRHVGNSCVVAGPGAGKTEFLAQRAAYLLETGLCRPPHRVLAISFKTDAASNLTTRIQQRCDPTNSNRFISLTFDAFTKGLIDRFSAIIPPPWRPTRQYKIHHPSKHQLDDFLDRTRIGAPLAWQKDIAALTALHFEPRLVGEFRLPQSPLNPTNGIEFAISRWWLENLQHSTGPIMTFVMINRLAELLLRTNAQVARALRATYPFVFIDEFQDTTYAQYDFLQSVFASSRTVVTAVGDDKQRIMAWAGARTDSFSKFQTDFSANKIPLLCNFRSSPELIHIQHVVARALDKESSPAVSYSTKKITGDVAQIWNCRTEASEAKYLATWLSEDIARRRTSARDYVLLVRQSAEQFEGKFRDPLATVGLSIRNESRSLGKTTLQELLTEKFTSVSLALLRLGAKRQAPLAWRTATTFVEQLQANGEIDETASNRAEKSLTAFLRELRSAMALAPPSEASVRDISSRILTFLNRDALSQTYQEYNSGDKLQIAIEAFHLHLSSCASTASNWDSCISAFEGQGRIPLMTIHKSKGLEFDTIIFVGLDDKMWWSHVAGNPEGIATFFVALSRAKQRAIFTFCSERGQRKRTADIYQLLNTAGVPEIQVSS
ncbi:UvrD-helicase domain-containing protein [Corallococcus sp. EGB]|uniref:UvrD-helicase domain-containing protein n=1 Tax=Corallococcus sp. EGB TaxID=1521117 RepID=UPI001CBEDF47|nr:ATP-dependent helicase [Corallococcus sp. EGB]